MITLVHPETEMFSLINRLSKKGVKIKAVIRKRKLRKKYPLIIFDKGRQMVYALHAHKLFVL